MPEFTKNYVWNFRNLDIVTSYFPPLTACAVTFINFLQLQHKLPVENKEKAPSCLDLEKDSPFTWLCFNTIGAARVNNFTGKNAIGASNAVRGGLEMHLLELSSCETILELTS